MIMLFDPIDTKQLSKDCMNLLLDNGKYIKSLRAFIIFWLWEDGTDELLCGFK